VTWGWMMRDELGRLLSRPHAKAKRIAMGRFL
jgi:hypothetical protein